MDEKYQASSPDEFSFVKFCAKLGIVYLSEKKDVFSSSMIRTISFRDQICKYQLLNVLDFDSNRRRMSVIVKDLQTEQIILLCKGAESSIFKCCTSGDIQSCDTNIKDFSMLGWRTLALAYKNLSVQEYQRVSARLDSAFSDITQRNKMLAAAYDEIESGLVLIGATAVEDKLQDQVADTLEFLREGGIKIWVLTGDKKETAINISNSCKHFSNEMVKMDLAGLSRSHQIRRRIDHYNKMYA
jgi:phospholipid-translocating ATPase